MGAAAHRLAGVGVEGLCALGGLDGFARNRLSIEEELVVAELHSVARKADDPLDVVFALAQRTGVKAAHREAGSVVDGEVVGRRRYAVWSEARDARSPDDWLIDERPSPAVDGRRERPCGGLAEFIERRGQPSTRRLHHLRHLFVATEEQLRGDLFDREAEDHDVTPLHVVPAGHIVACEGQPEAVGELLHKEEVAHQQGRLHRGRRDLEGLDDEATQKQRHADSHPNRLHILAELRLPGGLRG